MKTKSKLFAWLGLIVIVLAAFAMVAIPVFLIQPFAPQTGRDVSLSFTLKSWSPIMTIVATVLAGGIAFWVWRNSRRWWSKAFLIIPLFVTLFCVWFAQQNHFEWMFNPLHQAKFASVPSADFVKDNEMVLAVNINGDAVAFPVLQMAYHHIAQDVVGGTPITATY